jgi:DNA-binding MarR family transcriptional regulator
MTEITFTGDIHKITRLIEDYKQKGYVYKKHTEHPCDYIIRDDEGRKKVKTVIVYKVVMDKIQNNGFTIFVNGEPVSLKTYKSNLRTWAPNELETIQKINKEFTKDNLQEQLTEAVEREDYETAAILRDKINSLG